MCAWVSAKVAMKFSSFTVLIFLAGMRLTFIRVMRARSMPYGSLFKIPYTSKSNIQTPQRYEDEAHRAHRSAYDIMRKDFVWQEAIRGCPLMRKLKNCSRRYAKSARNKEWQSMAMQQSRQRLSLEQYLFTATRPPHPTIARPCRATPWQLQPCCTHAPKSWSQASSGYR